MSEDKKQQEEMNALLEKQGEILTDLIIRVASMEKLLLTQNIVTEEDFMKTISDVRDEIVNMVKESLAQNPQS